MCGLRVVVFALRARACGDPLAEYRSIPRAGGHARRHRAARLARRPDPRAPSSQVRLKKQELNKVIRDKEQVDVRLKSLQNSPDIVLAPLMCGAAAQCAVGDDEPADVDECNERLAVLQQHQRPRP